MRALLYATCGLLVALLLTSAPAAAQDVSNIGRDFITTLNVNSIDGPPIVEVHLTADTPTNVTVQYPVNAPTFSTTVGVTPGSITVVQLPSTASTGWTANAVGNNAVRMFGDADFVAYTVNRLNFTSDAALALPIAAFNTEYIVATYTATFRGQFSVYAAFDNTQVTITPARALVGRTGGTPFTVTLNRGQAYYGEAASSGVNGDLTGTRIEATRPVGLTNGNFCTNIPPGTFACDHIYEVAQPLASWGTNAIAAPLANRPGGSVYRVIAGADGVGISRNGANLGTRNKGGFFDTGIVAGPQYFAANGPIFVVQYMTGQDSPGAVAGDPAMGNIAPSEQYLRSYTFSTIAGAFSQHFLSVVAQNADVTSGLVRLDGAPMSEALFSPIPGTSFSYATVPITSGTHTTSSTTPHGITVAGYNNFNSYLYPGGAQFSFINQGADNTPPVCSGAVAGGVFQGTATDLRSADPDNQGIFFVQLAPGSDNLTLTVAPFTPGDQSVSYTVSLTNAALDGSGVVVVTDGAGNQCRQQIALTGGGTPPDATPPVCGAITVDRAGGRVVAMNTTATDPESGIASVTFTTLRNFTGFVDGNGPFVQNDTYTPPPGTTSIAIRGERLNLSLGGAVVARVTNGAGLSSLCDPVVAQLDGAAETFALHQNTPNPVGASGTQFRFALAEAAPVRLSVYDALGREVARVIDETMAPGTYSVSWDGQDAFGRRLAPGVYVYRLDAGAFSASHRLTVVR